MRIAHASTLTRSSRALAAVQRRALHTRTELRYNVDHGLGDFLPPAALKIVAVDYQQGLLDRLNQLIPTTKYETMSLPQTVIQSAPNAQDIAIFNTASQALNNAFFLDNLRPSEPDADADLKGNSEFANKVIQSFGTIENMKSVVSATAMGMTSSGWVWLVEDMRGELAALPTFGAGTVLVKERLHNGGTVYYGTNNPPVSPSPTPASSSSPPRSGMSSPTSGTIHPHPRRNPPDSRAIHATKVAAQVGVTSPFKPMHGLNYGVSSGAVNPNLIESQRQHMVEARQQIGEQLTPLFCISIHEHAWMAAGLGVWGKEAYLQRFWTALDWSWLLRDFSSSSTLGHAGSRGYL
ncbi:hypothetical protein BKA62DRAFT_830784 [Auriculariales sp. MPI-PUGE-AT-0066]|nr:hypothetical protein BKA62DRAFT_830784 [Auriculariales sp. MPI-PUGE-AT-0066]